MSEEEIYRRKKDKEAIVKLLLSPKLTRTDMVLPIVGRGGMGKTMLAQHVFNDPRVQEHFEERIWVCVSDDFDVRRILEQILLRTRAAANFSTAKNLSFNQLHNLLPEFLHKKQYPIVLDHVWREDSEKWDQLKQCVLQLGFKGESAIILTCRPLKVASIAGTIQPYELGLLTEEQSWTLFQTKAFPQSRLTT
ncbi:hypothetical protein TIFTF001_022732 [Ficus carica]|uniref:NB-ARC domain-containing protein n=1 Tax=Ficus carica TaxID=3494 RepID=A0AA88DES3_FICCA|nr:hypothetical protein TIFTF001_022732 [Ficus carica]